jgi:hypothetical protein
VQCKDKDFSLIDRINDRTILKFLLRHIRTKDRSCVDPDNNIQHAFYKRDIIEEDYINSSKNVLTDMTI